MVTRIVLLLTMMLTFAACQDTGNTAQDAQSAQYLLPNIAGYTVSDVDTAVDGAFAAAGGAALASGQVGVSAAIAKADQMIQCFQDRGAVAAKFYTETTPTDVIPKVGAVLVINETRISQEFLNCALSGTGFSSQAVVEVCADSGNFTYNGDQISYAYFGSQPEVCQLFAQHFVNLKQ